MGKPTEDIENKRNNPRIVGDRIKVIPGTIGLELETELVDPAHQDFFELRDIEGFDDLSDEQENSKENTKKRKNSGRQGNERVVPANHRVQADDYKGEPPYLHAGIHLVGRTQDQIQWFCDSDCVIDVGHDPELHLTKGALNHRTALRTVSLHASVNSDFNPFTDPFPKFCSAGGSVLSGPPRLQGPGLHPDVKKQKYYKFTVTLLNTSILLDPHIDMHDY